MHTNLKIDATFNIKEIFVNGNMSFRTHKYCYTHIRSLVHEIETANVQLDTHSLVVSIQLS